MSPNGVTDGKTIKFSPPLKPEICNFFLFFVRARTLVSPTAKTENVREVSKEGKDAFVLN
jgi:hypothetical protein